MLDMQVLLLTADLSYSLLLTVTLSPSTGPEEEDRHPERRMKAAFAAYEETNMPRLKQENPNMRLSQLKQQLKKEWNKAPENPLNQRFSSYNSKWNCSYCHDSSWKLQGHILETFIQKSNTFSQKCVLLMSFASKHSYIHTCARRIDSFFHLLAKNQIYHFNNS